MTVLAALQIVILALAIGMTWLGVVYLHRAAASWREAEASWRELREILTDTIDRQAAELRHEQRRSAELSKALQQVTNYNPGGGR